MPTFAAIFLDFFHHRYLMEYNPQEIEQKWQARWKADKTYATKNESTLPKYYVLDMFPYPSGAGLHVGHPLGYIASDIVSRYKRHCGFNVLHPMGYDSFGLPAEQYAIQTGQHPAVTTEENINRYRQQLDRIGFSFDWDREVRTSDPKYYKWTQWIFIQLFHSYYNYQLQKAEPISKLVSLLENEGFKGPDHAFLTGDIEHDLNPFTAADWKGFSEAQQEEILANFRLAYLSEAYVNWCPAMGTVLANEEVKDGVSERGGYPVERKLMKQWSLRITAYAERLYADLDGIDWSDSIKESQRNWIGKSVGASITFPVSGFEFGVEVFTTRPDTIFGVSFLTLAPEHELVQKITTPEYKAAVDEYVHYATNRSERERMADVKTITGQFTGAYALHPFTKQPIPVWIGDYVLVGYGTGAVMAVPCGDQRDYDFAKHFNLPIPPVFDGVDISEKADATKEARMINSDFLNGLTGYEAIKKCIEKLEEKGIGKGKVNYRLRDAIFGRQRYWGEPIPIYYENGIPKTFKEEHLPLVLPEVDKFLPTEDGEPPLARAKNWWYSPKEGVCTPPSGQATTSPSPLERGAGGEAGLGGEIETTTMPGWAGSSWYFLRYMDATNEGEFVSKEAANYWQQVDLYLGGAEHATGHLLYVRFWTKFLNDLGYIPVNEPAKKLINQGMIQGRSNFVYRDVESHKFVSHGLIKNYKTTQIHVDVNIVSNDLLDIEAFKNWREEYKNAEFILESTDGGTPLSKGEGSGVYKCGWEVEKMSKSKWNVVSPDDICNEHGADTLRLYEMFLGPIEQHKPWNTNGISGVTGFLRKFWKLYTPLFNLDANSPAPLERGSGGEAELKILHKTIKKVTDDIERYSFNTVVSAFMIATNELGELKCSKKAILEPLLVLLSPFAPHIAEELWEKLGNTNSVTQAAWPTFNPAFLVENSVSYPVQFNGKMRFTLEIPVAYTREQIEAEVLGQEATNRYLEGKAPKKVIVVPNKIVNIVY